jgi:AP-1 complex subunit sigma 1/2
MALPDSKIVYRRYASLFFIAGCNSADNELITLEIVHRYVEAMDKYYGMCYLQGGMVWIMLTDAGNVCELDIVRFTPCHYRHVD